MSDNCQHVRTRRVGRRRNGAAVVDEICPECWATIEQDVLGATVDIDRGVATDGGEPSNERRSSSEQSSDGGDPVLVALLRDVDGIGATTARTIAEEFDDREDLRDVVEDIPPGYSPSRLSNLDGFGPTKARTMAKRIDRSGVLDVATDGGEVRPPALPETVGEATEIEEAHTIVFEDGSAYALSGTEVLAVYAKHGRDAFYEWEGTVIDRIEEWHDAGHYPAKYGTQAVEPGESMADIAEEAIYYGDLRATQMQIALVAIADDEEEEEPVEVVGLTADGQRDYDVDAALGGGADV